MVCHMHQPNSFLNTYYGFQMWSYETDGAPMWPKDEVSPSNSGWFDRIDRNPEEAAVRGNWGDREFLRDVPSLNPQLEHTQFADYHGHGWIFRAVFKTDRHGNLLDRDGNRVRYDDPKKFEGVIPALGEIDPKTTAEQLRQRFEPKPGKPVHLMDIHAERGMHCVDCHYQPDVHGNGLLYSEYQAAIQVACEDCHGTAERYATLAPSGPASRGPGLPAPRKFEDDRTPWKKERFVVSGGAVKQRSMLYENVEWAVPQVKDSVTPGHASYNERAAFAKLQQDSAGRLAHAPTKMDCATCHTSWVTSCFGCHLPQKANWRSDLHHFEGTQLRNLASYNPQVARDDAFMLGIAPDVKDSVVDGTRTDKIGVVRSSSAILISSEDAQRRIIYKQLPTVAGNGMSSQAFNTHFAHTVRTTETRTCSDCHLSEAEDNNAWLAQVLLLGTGTVNFMGMHAYVGTGDGVEAVVVSEWDEPQAIVGSNLHRLAFPERFADHVEDDRKLSTSVHHGGSEILGVQLRGEYVYTACGSGGFRVYDVANVANKDFSEKIVTSPVSPFGQDTHVGTEDATCVALPTNNSISVSRTFRPENRETDYAYRGRSQYLHESYRYAYVTDRREGLILVDVERLNDGDPDNNFLDRALTFNPDGVLDGAVFAVVAGTHVYVCCDRGVVVIDVDDPLEPRVVGAVGAPAVTKPTSIAVQFRYAFVTDAEGLKVLDVTKPEAVTAVTQARVELAGARHVYVARTWGYVSTPEGMVIVDLEKPASPRKVEVFTADGRITDLHQVQVGAAYDSFYAFLADGKNGLHVVQLVTPEDGGRSAYGFAPSPRPKLIATYETSSPALALSRGLDRDRAVDESGHQVAVFGRIGGRPFNLAEMRRLYQKPDGSLYRVPASASPPKDWKPAPPKPR
jgi:hypothetical protein